MRSVMLGGFAGLLIAFLSISAAQAGPPMTGSSQSTGGRLMSALNPTHWSWPSMPWTAEKPRIQKKTPSVMSSMNKSAKSGFAKTKRALDPTRMFSSSEKEQRPSSSSRSTQADGGYFSGLFKSDEPTEIHTANDFLSLPRPR